MLEPKPKTGLPAWSLVFLAAAIGGGAYYLGRRAAPRPPVSAPAPSAPPAEVAQAVADSGAAPAADASVVLAAVVDAGSPEPASGHHVLVATLAGSLDQTVQAAAPPEVGPALAMVVGRLLVWWFQPAHDARPGDKLAVVYDTPPGQEPAILALSYQSQKNGRGYRTYRFQSSTSHFGRYYTPDGAELEERLASGPIDDYEQVTSLLRDGRGHKGVDFKAPAGTPVHSPVDGEIVRRNWHWRANGNCLEIADGQSGRHAIFLHLQEVPASMKVGVKVRRGEQIALSGNTGHTTAPHLHYQLMSPDGRVLDPFKIHKIERRSLSAADLPAFQAEVSRLDALLDGQTASR